MAETRFYINVNKGSDMFGTLYVSFDVGETIYEDLTAGVQRPNPDLVEITEAEYEHRKASMRSPYPDCEICHEYKETGYTCPRCAVTFFMVP